MVYSLRITRGEIKLGIGLTILFFYLGRQIVANVTDIRNAVFDHQWHVGRHRQLHLLKKMQPDFYVITHSTHLSGHYCHERRRTINMQVRAGCLKCRVSLYSRVKSLICLFWYSRMLKLTHVQDQYGWNFPSRFYLVNSIMRQHLIENCTISIPILAKSKPSRSFTGPPNLTIDDGHLDWLEMALKNVFENLNQDHLINNIVNKYHMKLLLPEDSKMWPQ